MSDVKPFVHFFVRRKAPWPFCILCGTVRRAKGPQSGCRGLVKITTRRLEPTAEVKIEGARGIWIVERLVPFEGRTMVACISKDGNRAIAIDRSKVSLA